MKKSTTAVLIIVVALGLVGVYALLTQPLPDLVNDEIAVGLTEEEKAQIYTRAPEIVAPSGYINTEPVTLESLRGKVVLLDIWTYSCINCQRTLPYINAWYDKYRDQGLEIIGLHSPEFEFEKDINNVRDAVERFGVEYPVALDNDFATWRAYENQWWPRKFLIDIDGFVVYDHIGEGAYEQTERVIQQLLNERNNRLGLDLETDSNIVEPDGTESVQSGFKYTPEVYFGAWRNQSTLGNGVPSVIGEQELLVPEELEINHVYHGGSWQFEREFAVNKSERARIVLPYQASKVFMVASADKPVNVQVLIDGELVTDMAGEHVSNGVVTVQNEQLYNLIDDPDGWGEHTLELIIENPGLKAFTFTFG